MIACVAAVAAQPLDLIEAAPANVLLLSMRSGGFSGAAGLTLTAANHAFILDPAWNPALEDQAVARINRIGQKRPTTIWRLRVEGTVEDHVADIADRKRRTGKNRSSSQGDDETAGTSSFTAQVAGDMYSTQDVLRLFGMADR